ncbi:MAG: hypothetical protein ACLSAF_07710 [Intestinimonas sp.]
MNAAETLARYGAAACGAAGCADRSGSWGELGGGGGPDGRGPSRGRRTGWGAAGLRQKTAARSMNLKSAL